MFVESETIHYRLTDATSEKNGTFRNVAQFGRLTKELQHSSMSLRLIPIKPTFQKMERLARDLSRDFGKKINFRVAGDDTELDRTVVEDIGDPLVHMVRNSLDYAFVDAPTKARLKQDLESAFRRFEQQAPAAPAK